MTKLQQAHQDEAKQHRLPVHAGKPRLCHLHLAWTGLAPHVFQHHFVYAVKVVTAAQSLSTVVQAEHSNTKHAGWPQSTAAGSWSAKKAV